MSWNEWEIILKALGVLVTVVVAVWQIANRLSKDRTRLKHDLEILRLIDKDDPHYPIVKAQVERSIGRVFEAGAGDSGLIRGRFVIHQWGAFIFGILLLFGGLIWTLYLVKDQFSWWVLLSGFIALAGFGNVLAGFEDRGRGEPEASSPQAAPAEASEKPAG